MLDALDYANQPKKEVTFSDVFGCYFFGALWTRVGVADCGIDAFFAKIMLARKEAIGCFRFVIEVSEAFEAIILEDDHKFFGGSAFVEALKGSK